MARESFKKDKSTTEEPAQEQLAVKTDTQIAAPIAPQDDMAGHIDIGDVRLPRINLIHKTSDSAMVEKFGIGSFVLNKEVKLSDGKTPLQITALRFAKDYVQKLPYGDPEQPAVFKTPEEVTQAGFSLNYKDYDSGQFCQPRAHIQVVVAKPADADEALFPYEHNGMAYAMAMLTVSSSAYTSVGKEIVTLRNNNRVMRKGLRFGALALTSETRKNAKNDWRVPVIKYTGENPEDLVAFFESIQ